MADYKTYTIQAYLQSGDLSYTLVVNTYKEMLQALQDAIHDGFSVLVMPNL